MAVWMASGVLFLVLFTGTSCGYPVKQDPSSSDRSTYNANPASSAKLSLPSSRFSHANPRPNLGTASNAGYSQIARNNARSYQPGVGKAAPVAAAFNANAYAAPVYSGYDTSSSGGSTYPSSSSQGTPWTHTPASSLSGEESSTGPGARQSVSRFGTSNMRLPGPLPPQFQAGELSQLEKVYEFGNSDSETEEQGFLPQPPGIKANEAATSTVKHQSGPDRNWLEYPYDYMFLTGQYPPGTVAHYSSSYEQGNDHFQDTHYIRYNYPEYTSTGQDEALPAGYDAPHVQQPSQPVKQSTGSTNYGWSGAATGYNQPSGVFGHQSFVSQTGVSEQPQHHSPAEGHGFRKVGY